MMRIFLARDMPVGEILKEIFSAIAIVFVENLIGVALFESLRRYTRLLYGDTIEYASLSCALISFLFFLILRFPLTGAVGIALGASLVVLGSHQTDFLTAVWIWLIGFVATLRGFSEGPRPT